MIPPYEKILLERFSDLFAGFTELSSVALGAHVVSVSDEFFAEAENLLKVEPAPSFKGQFGPNGALYSGWESRRHNPSYDWCIVQLGTTGTVIGFDVDTSHFNGNEAPEVSISALHGIPTEKPLMDDPRWTDILPKVPLGPNSRHLFKIPVTGDLNFVKLNMYPDGGIARFRVYGNVSAVHPEDLRRPFDLANVYAGGHVEFTSDQHFGVGSNLILPGRGKDMSDGWETKRSRQIGHKDWAIIKLGTPGVLEHIVIDTAHFKGNFPESCEVHAALFASNSVDWRAQESQAQEWTLVLPRTRLGPHREHHFQFINVAGVTYTHVKVTIYPDGGIKRVRVVGRRVVLDDPTASVTVAPTSDAKALNRHSSTDGAVASKAGEAPRTTTVPLLPLTPEAFAPYGQVLQAYSDHAAQSGGTASKFHKLSLLHSTYPENSGATAGISIYRCKPLTDYAEDGSSPLKVLERHPFTNQAFIPMGRGNDDEAITDPADKYLVVVAKNGSDDKPDMQTLRGFVATATQGVVYDAGVWHQPMTVLERPLDLACVETQIGDGSPADCEILELESSFDVRLKLTR
ncbi:allantoicase [Amanita rubescens]|nr:allantoicase [Amanita rubescens]